MIIVDSCVWVDHFNGTENGPTQRLATAMVAGDQLAVIGVIITEVLQGFRSDHGFRTAQEALDRVTVVNPEVPTYVRAARLHRALRAKGITVPGTIDCLIAQTCIDAGAALLSSDRAFRAVAAAVDLKLV